jgi:hypothetical protein
VEHDQVKEAFSAEGYQLLSRYKNSGSKLKYRCALGHERAICWESFKSGSRCALCAKYGYKMNAPAHFYYLRFDFPGMPSLYKIGITNNPVSYRIGVHDMRYCTILMDEYYKDGSIPPIEELKILKRFKEWQYKGKAVLKNGGDTELFTRDVLMLDPASQLVS